MRPPTPGSSAVSRGGGARGSRGMTGAASVGLSVLYDSDGVRWRFGVRRLDAVLVCLFFCSRCVSLEHSLQSKAASSRRTPKRAVVMGYWMHVYSRTDEVMEVATIREFFEDDDVKLEFLGDQS